MISEVRRFDVATIFQMENGGRPIQETAKKGPGRSRELPVPAKMAYSLNARPGNDVAEELAAFLEKSLGVSNVLSRVKQDFKTGKPSGAISCLVSESVGLWKSDAASDKGM